MSDYIDREAAIDAICEHGTDLERNGITVLAVANHKQVTVDLLEQLPSANVEPVRHGQWIIRDNPGTGWYRVICSECGEDVTSVVPMIGFFPDAKVIWDYCPYCGAKMEPISASPENG